MHPSAGRMCRVLPGRAGGPASDLWFFHNPEDIRAGAGTRRILQIAKGAFLFGVADFKGQSRAQPARRAAAARSCPGRAVPVPARPPGIPRLPASVKSTFQKVKILTSLHKIKPHFPLSNVFSRGKIRQILFQLPTCRIRRNEI